jgi:hypothetical protein
MIQRHQPKTGARPAPRTTHRTQPAFLNQGMFFATGIENSNPTIENGRVRIDELESCGHYKLWSTDFDKVQEMGISFLRWEYRFCDTVRRCTKRFSRRTVTIGPLQIQR